MAQAQFVCTGQSIEGEKQRSVTYSTDQENKVRMVFINLVCVS